jgi:uncharacterized protein
MTPTDTRRTRLSILTYLVLTFGFSSIFYRLIIRHSPHDALTTGLSILGLMWCPGVSGLLTRLIFQRNLRGHGFGWGRTKYQAASYWIPLAYASVVYLPVWFAGYFDPHSPALAHFAARIPPSVPRAAVLPIFFVVLATVGMISSCLSALGEELGWRGYLVPQLAKVMPFTGVALTSGIVWALWHYPIVLFSFYHGPGPLGYSVMCFTVLVIGMSFLFAWMRLKSGSVWTGMLLHASHNLFIQSFFDPLTRHARITDLWTTEFGAGLALMGIVLAVIFYRKRGELPSQVA